MKIYRLTQYIQPYFNPEFDISFDFDMYDYYDMYTEHLSDIVSSFKNTEPLGKQLTWNPVSVNRLKPVYMHFVKRNYLDHRDIKAIHDILRDIISNIARLEASTALCGHDIYKLQDLFEEAGEYTIEEDSEEEEKFYNFMEWQGKSPISDYGLPKLKNIIQEMPANSHNPRQLLVILNKLLDVVHCRNDLASFLIEGGTETLRELSNLEI